VQRKLVAKAATTIEAPSSAVWKALVDPEAIKAYMFGAEVASDWREGSPITWKGEVKGRPFEDRGEVLEVVANRRLRYRHRGPLDGAPRDPDSYHTVTIDLARDHAGTHVVLTQDNNPDERARAHSERNWSAMLEGLKRYVEQ
jgi:uncharacterized protein YndB with AHSA1/START domain